MTTSFLEDPYPPCIFMAPEEKKLYNRLRDIWYQHSLSWDQESRDIWPFLISRASLASTTIKKVMSHTISKTITPENVTWAHVVVLKVIFKTALFRSKKIIRMVLAKYPRANFHTYAYDASYRLPLASKAKMPRHDLQVVEEEVLALDEESDDCRPPGGGSESWMEERASVDDGGASVSPYFRKTLRVNDGLHKEERDRSPSTTPPHIGNKRSVVIGRKRKRTNAGEADNSERIMHRKVVELTSASSTAACAAGSRTTNPLVKSEIGSSGIFEKIREIGLNRPLTSTESSENESSQESQLPSIRVENPLAMIDEQLKGHDSKLHALKIQSAEQAGQIKTLKLLVRELQALVRQYIPLERNPPEEDVKISVEKAM